MTRKQILALAKKADVWVAGQAPYQAQLERFANLVAAAEREACVRDCEKISTAVKDLYRAVAFACAERIKSRGNHEARHQA